MRVNPYVIEAAFGYCPHGFDERRIITGINWSPSIGADPFRSLGDYGESLASILKEQRARFNEPKAVEEAIEALEDEEIDVPDDLDRRVREYLEENPGKPWTEAVHRIADEEGE
jgi:hypothetical protein